MVDRRAIQHLETGRAIGHQPLALGIADRRTKVGLARQAGRAFAAFGRIKRDHMIAGLQRGHTLTHLKHNACTFMTQDAWKQPFGIRARPGKFIGVTQARCLDLDQDFARLRAVQFYFHDFQRLIGGQSDRCTRFHLVFLPVVFSAERPKQIISFRT